MGNALALSVHAPYAWALMFGGKDVENRSKNFPRRRDGEPVLGRVWVHASMWPGGKGYPRGKARLRQWSEEVGRMSFIAKQTNCYRTVSNGDLFELRGHIVSSIEVYDYRNPDDPPDSPWYIPGSLAVMMRNPRPLARPVPAKGALGWWRPDDATLRALEVANA